MCRSSCVVSCTHKQWRNLKCDHVIRSRRIPSFTRNMLDCIVAYAPSWWLIVDNQLKCYLRPGRTVMSTFLQTYAFLLMCLCYTKINVEVLNVIYIYCDCYSNRKWQMIGRLLFLLKIERSTGIDCCYTNKNKRRRLATC